VGEDLYPDVDSGMIGLLGFSEDQTPQAGVPESIIPAVQEIMAQAVAGDFNRFTVFTGPINDNQGNEIVPAGVTLTQSDLEGLVGIEGREDATIGMSWLAEGVVADAALPE
jgi:basic membrane protein A